jgi:hypothetical protein
MLISTKIWICKLSVYINVHMINKIVLMNLFEKTTGGWGGKENVRA